jgi:hypothetical protein
MARPLVHRRVGGRNREAKNMIWVVEYFGDRGNRSWLASGTPFRVTSTALEAATFQNEDDARREIGNLGLSTAWKVVGLRSSSDARSGEKS